MSTYTYTGKAKIITVAETGTYDITAFGAGGGESDTTSGGLGAEIGGDFALTAKEQLEIVVGGAGGNSSSGLDGGGGGGGSFVLANTGPGGSFVPLIVAGGGGGGYAGATSQNAGVPPATPSGNGSGGSAGGGGGGSGYKSGGQGSIVGYGGSNRTGNYAGGASYQGESGAGGFGGGGGGGAFISSGDESLYGGGGGGGGFSGGAGGYTSSGGGGTSYDAGTPIAAQTVAGKNDGDGRITITPNAVVCFAAGTLIRTARGDVAVEALQVGDLAVTTSGAQRPIRWLGHRIVDCRRHPEPRAVWPIRIRAHALGQDRPARDLFVSPSHAICVDALGEILIPASALVNGTSVRQVAVDTVIYWHVELETHDILLAENLPAESYLEMGNQAFFVEAGIVALAATPDTPARTHAAFCRPFHADGPLVAAVRAQVRGRPAAEVAAVA